MPRYSVQVTVMDVENRTTRVTKPAYVDAMDSWDASYKIKMSTRISAREAIIGTQTKIIETEEE